MQPNPRNAHAPTMRGANGAELGGRLHRNHTAIELEPADLSGARRWCPYGREVDASPGNVYVYAGPHAWDRATRRRAAHGNGSTLLLPPDCEPAEMRWPRMPRGCLVDGRDITRQQAVALAVAIVTAGTPLAFVVRDDEGFPVAARNWRNPLRQPVAEAA
jgi:hypothetical protein